MNFKYHWKRFWWKHHPEPNPRYGGRNPGHWTFRQQRVYNLLIVALAILLYFLAT